MKRVFIPQWVDPIPVEIPDELRQIIAGPELLLETLVRRGFTDPQKASAFLDPVKYIPAASAQMPGLLKAVERISSAIRTHEKIGIWGDFDVDGQTSTAVLVSALRSLDADVIYHIPIRAKESHGILLEPLKEFLALGVNLLVTCDTGISANDSIAYAHQSGVDVIITDHHSLPEVLPEAFSIINPQFLPEEHPLRTLSGVGATYKLVEQLFVDAGDRQSAMPLVDLVALGLIADLAILTGDTRYLVQKGLELIRSNPSLCLKTMLAESKIPSEQVNEETISYTIAPRLNAVGRLSDANPMVEFLLTDDPVFAATTFNQIEGLNANRKILCDQVFKGAQAQLEQNPKLLGQPLILLAHPEWPGGVVGIVASRLVELYHRPAILFNTSDQTIARGSARSIDGVNITAALQQNQVLLQTFGGHPMAAGLSTLIENIEPLRIALSATIKEMISRSNIQHALEIDSYVNPSTLDLDYLAALDRLSPFGPGNPPLQFAVKDLQIESINTIGRTKEHLQAIVHTANGENFKVIWWQGAGLPQPDGTFDLALKARASNYRGEVSVQFEWVDFRDCADRIPDRPKKFLQNQIENIDLRTSLNPDSGLMQIIEKSDICIWSEGSATCPIPAFDRTKLSPSKYLVIWTIPPSPVELRDAIVKVKPEKIYWFGNYPQITDLKGLLTSTASLVKKLLALSEQPQILFSEMAAQLGITPAIAALLIKWFVAHGDFSLGELNNTTTIISPLTEQKSEELCQKIQIQLQDLLKEVNAYRSTYMKTYPVSFLIPEIKTN